MKPFEVEIDKLKELSSEMFELVQQQIMLTKDALINNDQELSCEIMRKEKRVNAMEIAIDRECEQYIAMQHPVASDLRFAIAIIKISGSLERIGDHAYRICSFVFDDLMSLNSELIKEASLETIFEEIDSMLNNVAEALNTGNSELAKKVFKQDKVLDKVNKNLHKFLETYAAQNNDEINRCFLLLKTISKLERVGDLIKNMAEEVLFYHDSKVVKHKKKNKRIDKRLGEK